MYYIDRTARLDAPNTKGPVGHLCSWSSETGEKKIGPARPRTEGGQPAAAAAAVVESSFGIQRPSCTHQ